MIDVVCSGIVSSSRNDFMVGQQHDLMMALVVSCSIFGTLISTSLPIHLIFSLELSFTVYLVASSKMTLKIEVNHIPLINKDFYFNIIYAS